MSDDLLIKYLLRETSPEEDIELSHWLAEDSENRKEFERFELIWNESKKLEQNSTVDPEAAWVKFKEQIPATAPRAVIRPISNRFGWLRIAAVLFIIAGAWSFYLILRQNGYNTISSGQMVRTEVLPDGSEVTLNKNAVLSYKKDFKGNMRSVKLEQGEVFFDVSPDKARPFIIDADQVNIRVLGTSFNVKKNSDLTEVIVESGLVRVSLKDQQIELKKGEKVLIKGTEAKLQKELSTDNLYNYYRTNIFVADNTPLWRMVEILNEAYEVKIEIADPKLRDLTLNTTFKGESLDTILHIISETLRIKVQKEGDKIILN
ncbi:MAG: FecR domain-containing protein [Daejeonella sp.]|uniref:FecR domain-containing protein n=1 Tax=Daejeonella sp. TaxID=2805397 RepID=UPI002735A121|nr:FecR domain-containing protein [Daejeonella sp.]MDP3466703.1 FecR domain-containing protein [Daejeonella sp.]